MFSPLGKGHSQLALTPLEKEARGDFINSPLYKRREGGGFHTPPLQTRHMNTADLGPGIPGPYIFWQVRLWIAGAGFHARPPCYPINAIVDCNNRFRLGPHFWQVKDWYIFVGRGMPCMLKVGSWRSEVGENNKIQEPVSRTFIRKILCVCRGEACLARAGHRHLPDRVFCRKRSILLLKL